MVHHIYHTRGVILESTPKGESSRSYRIFTEELGLVSATAQSVREGRSKLRYVLQDHSFVRVDLVRGKEVWRIVSAGSDRAMDAIKNDIVRVKIFARVCSLVLRLIHGESRDLEIFREMERIVDFLETHAIERSHVLVFETLIALRMLSLLGYVNDATFTEFVASDAYSFDLLDRFESVRAPALATIKSALDASHL